MSGIKAELMKWPDVPFTHTELGEFNGVDRHDVWSRYQRAIKIGYILPTGNLRKNGRGKAAVEWILNPNYVEVAEVAEVPKPVKVPKQKKIEVVKLDPIVVVEVSPEVKEETPAPVINPIPQVVVQEVIEPEPIDLIVKAETLSPTEITDVCPICEKPLYAIKDATGFMVWCAQTIDVCKSTENPCGHANTVKNACEVLKQKFTFGKK